MQRERREDIYYSPTSNLRTFPSSTFWFPPLVLFFQRNPFFPLSLDWEKAERLKGPQQKNVAAGTSLSTPAALPCLLGCLLPSLEAETIGHFLSVSHCSTHSASQGGFLPFFGNHKLVQITVGCPEIIRSW